MEVLENTGARRFDFDAVVAAIRTSGRFLYMMCEQEKTGPKENGDGRGGDESDGNEVEEDEAPPNWWTPLLSSGGSGKVSNGPGTASFYG
jgi:hypothetical protein